LLFYYAHSLVILHYFRTRRSSDLVSPNPGPFSQSPDNRLWELHLQPFLSLNHLLHGRLALLGNFRTPSAATPLHHPVPSESENRSEEHTSELQSRFDLVCRLLLE